MTLPRRFACSLLVACLSLASCGFLPGRARLGGLIGSGDMVRIPMTDSAGDDHALLARICRPPGNAAAPVAVIAHGLPPDEVGRANMSPALCSSPPARWFRARGYVSVFALRRGYGGSEGDWAENPGPCASPDYARAGREGARDLAAVLSFAVAQPYAKADRAVVIGEDAGGWAVLGYASQPHPIAAALVDIGGAMGGRAAIDLGHICRPDLLIEAAARFGATAKTPMLWIYPANDAVIPSAVVAGLHDAFEGAGGQADLVQPTAPSADGHDMLFNDDGAAIWGGAVESFLRRK